MECYFSCTRETCHCNTIEFIPNQISFPKVTLKDFLIQIPTDIITILSQPKKNKSIPALEDGDLVKNILLKIAEQLKRVEKLPKLVPTEPSLYQA